MVEARRQAKFSPRPRLSPPTFFRDLSAPVKLRYKYSDEDLAFLMKYDTDSFNRWEAGQQVRYGAVRYGKVRYGTPW